MTVEWTVVTVLIALVGLFATVTKPIMNFNTAIVKLTTKLDALTEHNKAMDKKNQEIHATMHADINALKETTTDHESRLITMEVMNGGIK